MTDSRRLMFSAARIDKLIADALPTDAQPGEKIVVATVDDQGTKVTAAFKFMAPVLGHPVSWQLQAVGALNWSGDVAGAGQIIMRWP